MDDYEDKLANEAEAKLIRELHHCATAQSPVASLQAEMLKALAALRQARAAEALAEAVRLVAGQLEEIDRSMVDTASTIDSAMKDLAASIEVAGGS